jgi:phosphoglycolate phosphatase-like HAD superfamily hydrolase
MGEAYRKMQKKVILNNGVRQLLAILASSTDDITDVLTGNLTAVAEEKLTLAGIRTYFSELFCADNYFDRKSLVEDAVRTCMTKYELNTRRDVVIVGDTPLDIQAANASNVTSVGAACGIYTTTQLTEAGAKRVFPDLEPTGELLAALAAAR